jgi:ankyrin repeat protein
VNVVRRDGKSALQLAIDSDSARRFEMLETLLKVGADVNVVRHDSMGETEMATACRVGNFEVFEKLLMAGADVNVVRHDGASALQLAIVSGKDRRFEIIEALLKAKADVNVGRHEGKSALVLALISGNAADDDARRFGLTEALLEAGADYKMISNLVSALHEAGADVNCTDTNGSSSAVLMRTFLNVRKTLIAPVPSVALNTSTRCLCAALELGDHDLLQALLQFDVDVNCDADGEIPLIMASKLGHLGILEKLLEEGVQVNFKDADDKTATDLAASNKIRVIQYIFLNCC